MKRQTDTGQPIPYRLDTPRADSVNADAHCAIVVSDAPEQIISRIIIHINGSRRSLRSGKPSPSSYQAINGAGEELKDIDQRHQCPNQREYFPMLDTKHHKKEEWSPK